jgi:hypothetical protein
MVFSLSADFIVKILELGSRQLHLSGSGGVAFAHRLAYTSCLPAMKFE